MDDSTRPAVLEGALAELARLLAWVTEATEGDLGAAEEVVRDGVLGIGARVLAAGLAARGAGKAGPRLPGPCGAAAAFAGYRPKGVQTPVGWSAVRRAYYHCPGCGRGVCPLDAAPGLERDAHSPGLRRLAGRFGALLPFAQAAATPTEAAGVRLSASTVRAVTETLGARQEAAVAAEVERAWRAGLPAVAACPPARLDVAMAGVRILGTDGAGKEAKVGGVVPARRAGAGEARDPASDAAAFEPAEAFGRRLALEAHRRGVEGAGAVAVLGDGAAGIRNLAAEHFPAATCIVDWYHASERVWDLGRAPFGEGTAAAVAWVERQLGRLAAGEAAALATEWAALPCRGEAAAVRAEQATSFANQASRMADAADRAAGWDLGSGLVEGACKHPIGAREKGPGMRWGVAGANAAAQTRVLLFHDRWDETRAAA